MAKLTVRDLQDDVYRALRMRAATHGRTTGAEARAILEAALKPKGQVELGTLIAAIGRRAALTGDELAAFNPRERPATLLRLK